MLRWRFSVHLFLLLFADFLTPSVRSGSVLRIQPQGFSYGIAVRRSGAQCPEFPTVETNLVYTLPPAFPQPSFFCLTHFDSGECLPWDGVSTFAPVTLPTAETIFVNVLNAEYERTLGLAQGFILDAYCKGGDRENMMMSMESKTEEFNATLSLLDVTLLGGNMSELCVYGRLDYKCKVVSKVEDDWRLLATRR